MKLKGLPQKRSPSRWGENMEQNKIDKIENVLADIARYQQETNLALVRMEGKMDKMELALNAKLDQHRAETDARVQELTRDVRDLEAFRVKHEDLHLQDAKGKNHMLWGLISTGVISVAGWVITLLQ